MRFNDLLAFVQDHYSSLQGIPPVGQEEDRARDELLADDPNAVRRPRPIPPDWLEDRERVVAPFGQGLVLILEGDSEPISMPLDDLHEEPDSLAYYLPFHFYRDQWGIYLRGSGLVVLASYLKGAPVSRADTAFLEMSRRLLFEHEILHFIAEVACSRAEITAKQRLYESYFTNTAASPHEEALANASAHNRSLRGHTSHLRARADRWMSGQGPGYRDFPRWKGPRRFELGCRRAAHYMTAPVRGVRALPAGEPAEFLFEGARRVGVPTYCVLDLATLGVMRPFPKAYGMQIQVHTKDHPPPHIHIEMPPGHDFTRYEWPTLMPLKGDQKLSGADKKSLVKYLEEYGDTIDGKVRAVYPDLKIGKSASRPEA